LADIPKNMDSLKVCSTRYIILKKIEVNLRSAPIELQNMPTNKYDSYTSHELQLGGHVIRSM